jgi:twitching motility two-component system response regulator PilG
MKIGTLGFPSDQLKKLEKILSLSKRPLVLVSFDQNELPDLLLVFGPEQLQQPAVSELPQ